MKTIATITEYPLTHAGVRQALEALGRTPDEVAVTLLAGGHRGLPANAGLRPVSDYLAALYPRMKVSVGPRNASVGSRLDVELPAPVAEFVILFDDAADKYAHLNVEELP